MRHSVRSPRRCASRGPARAAEDLTIVSTPPRARRAATSTQYIARIGPHLQPRDRTLFDAGTGR